MSIMLISTKTETIVIRYTTLGLRKINTVQK